MKKILMTIAAVLCCAISVTVGLTSCSQIDNPIEAQPEKQVAMADVITIDGARQSLYKLPEGEGLMINFRYELELNITE